MPREKLYVRYCPMHKNMLALDDYEKIGYDELNRIFNEEQTLLDIREKFLNGDFQGAGCPEACNFMSAFRVGGASYSVGDGNAAGQASFKKAYLSLGPDCNIRCRYCLDTDNFNVDFGSCKPKFADFIVPFVHNGGRLLLTGGETFLPKWGFTDKLKELARLGENKGSIEVYTNGTLLDEETCDAVLAAPVHFVGISMDTSRPELFNYIRRGSDFAQVLGNAKKLLDLRNERGQALPQIKILCAVLKSTAEHLEETVDFYLNEGFDVSLNILFAANFSPDFCERESMDALNSDQLRNVSDQLERSKKKWGDRLFSAAFEGQLMNVVKQKSVCATAQQILGGGHYAKRKEGVNPSIKDAVGKVKIFVSHHKDGEILKSDILTPIHVGAATSGVKLDMQRDDEGENISAKNDRFCELTAQYWAWKNADADYYGFMHYRRHFAFRSIPDAVGLGGVVILPRLDDDYKRYIGLSDNEIYACVKDYDILLPTPIDASVWGTLSNEVQFSSLDNLHAVDFDLTCGTVLELFPEYAAALEEFRNGKYAYWYNMFVMRREIFRDYCEWLFAVLEKAEAKIDFSCFSEQETRTLAFMAERLLSVYVLHLQKQKPDLKMKHLKITLLKKTDKTPNVHPAFERNNVAIAVSCNEYYMPIFGVMLNSLLENTSPENNYDILAMRNIPEFDSDDAIRNMKMLQKLVGRHHNAKIRFVDISGLIGDKDFFVRGNFTPETYFRLFLPQVLSNYEKVLYLDADTVVCRDVAELYNIDLDGAILGAVRDPIISGSNKSPAYNKRADMAKLGIKNIYDYFQAGVLLIDLKKISENGLCDKMIEYAATHDCDLVDQDVLNLFCQGRVKFIDNKWNVDVNSIAVKVAPYAPAAMWKDYKANREHAYIYHFAGADKPWDNPALDKADIFWEAARKTPWYEIVLEDLIGSSSFFRRGIVTKSDPVLDRLSLWPDDVAGMVIPIVKAFSELSPIGLSGALYKAIRNEDDGYTSLTSGKSVIFYGAGNCCRQILLYFDQIGLAYPAAVWDRAAKRGERLFGIPVLPPDFESLNGRDDVLCVITIESQTISAVVKKQFNDSGFTNIIENRDIMRVVSRRLWLKLEEESGSDVRNC
jgi:lipopolysaccharide biosynthesis glycosyltransferase/MoaA/NifB/PqqE/SkfB family radical SAM enzyme